MRDETTRAAIWEMCCYLFQHSSSHTCWHFLNLVYSSYMFLYVISFMDRQLLFHVEVFVISSKMNSGLTVNRLLIHSLPPPTLWGKCSSVSQWPRHMVISHHNRMNGHDRVLSGWHVGPRACTWPTALSWVCVYQHVYWLHLSRYHMWYCSIFVFSL